MNMREKVARALCNLEWGAENPEKWERADALLRQRYLEYADAILDALYEPNEAMVKAGRSSVSGHMRSEGVTAIWQAMIAQAKAER